MCVCGLYVEVASVCASLHAVRCLAHPLQCVRKMYMCKSFKGVLCVLKSFKGVSSHIHP